MSFILVVEPSQTRSFPIKRRVIWVPEREREREKKKRETHRIHVSFWYLLTFWLILMVNVGRLIYHTWILYGIVSKD